MQNIRNPFVRRVGGTLSADIAVPDHERELEFYSRILTTGSKPLWRKDLSNNCGTPVIGLGARTPEYETLPLQWMPHFQVADVAASAKCASNMGGTILMQSKPDDGSSHSQGQWAVLVDPFGAAFGVIPVVTSEAESTDQSENVGCISWLSLTVPDAQSSRDFYQEVVGWTAKTIETEQSEELVTKFEMQIDDQTSAAEIRQRLNDDDGIPADWLLHLPVGDLTESLRLVRDGGGEVIKEFPKTQSATIRDPVGVHFALQGR